MAFWGIEVKPGEPYVYRSDDERGLLHLSQATLGNGSSKKKCILQCMVRDKKPIYLCSFLPERVETCALNLEFEEDDEVTFSIIGSHSVHLSGFFYIDSEDQNNLGDDYGSDSYEENVMVTDSEDENESSYDSEDEDVDDDYSDDGFDIGPHSPVLNSGVRIEEIVDEEKPTDENGLSKRTKKKKTESSMSSGNENSNYQIVAKAGNGIDIFESEDEDGFPISAHQIKSDISKDQTKLEETNDETIGEKTQKKSEKDDTVRGNKLKRKNDAVDEAGKSARENIEPLGSTVQPDTRKKNKNQKVAGKVESNQENRMPNSNVIEESAVAEIGNDVKPSSVKNKEKKKKKKKNKQQESGPTPSAEEKLTNENGSILEKQEKKEAKSLQVRTFPNGLVVEELVMGKPVGKRASRGEKVGVHYIGKLKKNGKIFDSNIGKAPYKFRLGIGQVIKGWDVGVNGMRVGDKRRLTIPPAMGYGPKGNPPAIPPNSWLVFDVELVDVK
ncbi:hypothetical protein OROMI_008526 [Orobanche minor]